MMILNEILHALIDGSLEVKLPTIWTDEKQSRAEAERRKRLEERRSEKRKSQKKEDAYAKR
jgi:RNase H-fold protein (predicted Holliday junction resolvase)